MITILPDFREEGWHSMDLCADMLVKYAPHDFEIRISVPHYRKLLGFLPLKKAKNFDRWYNRWRVYPKHVQKLSRQSGFFHIVDHSYAHLANYLPEGRVGVYCHDLDAFRCLLAPDQEPRPDWFKKMMSSVFEGLKKARIVFCSTKVTQQSLLSLGYWDSKSIYVVPYGTAEEFQPEGSREAGDYILHVGSCIPRKRIDVLLRAFSEVCNLSHHKNLKLIQAGGIFSSEQRRQIQDLGLISRVEQRQNLTREDLARLYRGAKCLVITSDAEGFGLPLIEGLSCGVRVVASNIPSLREVGGHEVSFFEAGDFKACAQMIVNNIQNPVLNHFFGNSHWIWSIHADKIISAYERLKIII